MTKVYLTVTIDQEIDRWIEKARGTTPRSTFVNELLRAAMKKTKIKIITMEIDGSELIE